MLDDIDSKKSGFKRVEENKKLKMQNTERKTTKKKMKKVIIIIRKVP